ncbi:MAG TPA: hypothetical protein VFK89_03335 [Actinomycetota bacterium]|nr:hypothetical protein [Actinomycetota bacterium]
MDESTVREHAEAHGRAMVEGDMRRAGGDLSPEAQKQAPAVMSNFPKRVESAEVVSLSVEGEAAVTQALYKGEGKDVTVEARWEERDGRPKIVDMKVV